MSTEIAAGQFDSRGGLEYKKMGVLVVSLRGINFRFWLAKSVEEKSPIFLAFKVSLRVAREGMQQFFLKKLAQISLF